MNRDACVAIVGGSASGKSTELLARARACEGTPLVLASSEAPLRLARASLGNDAQIQTTGAFAISLLREPARIVDDVEAELLFARAAAPLLALEWPEFSDETLDPEVPGLRAPQRFLEAAFRLARKLRDAGVSPEEFLRTSQVGATQFYAHPPNLANPDLLHYTKDTYRDSLDVTDDELQRQFRHESHLAQILAKLYRAYADATQTARLLTQRDAIAEAALLLRANPAYAISVRDRFGGVFVDDAQELNVGELQLLQALCGDDLAGVTLAGDRDGAIGTFRGARPDRTFALATQRVECVQRYRADVPIRVHRAPERADEARWIADEVRRLLREGAAPQQIAILFRSVSDVRLYEEALLARDVPVQTIGDVNLFLDPRALDALALLWNVHDPFAHDWLLRTLAGPAMALSDATLAALCATPPDAQTLLFPEEESPTAKPAKRWDAQRDLRLGFNALRGDVDAQLSGIARERLNRFRAMRATWVEAAAALRASELALLAWRDGLARAGPPQSAKARSQRIVLERLLERMRAFERERPQANLGDFLDDARLSAHSALEACEEREDDSSVRLISIEAARGRSFDHVFVAGARPGSFPRWYVPDAFVYSPSLGMIAKENVGDARAARTAKFTYYMFRAKIRERYNDEDRRAFGYALSRAAKSITVTASERPTRGITAPEFLEELKRRPGVEVV
jgi:superfamily I DNA/RNA helicase